MISPISAVNKAIPLAKEFGGEMLSPLSAFSTGAMFTKGAISAAYRVEDEPTVDRAVFETERAVGVAAFMAPATAAYKMMETKIPSLKAASITKRLATYSAVVLPFLALGEAISRKVMDPEEFSANATKAQEVDLNANDLEDLAASSPVTTKTTATSFHPAAVSLSFQPLATTSVTFRAQRSSYPSHYSLSSNPSFGYYTANSKPFNSNTYSAH
ncbi:MAG: hypothetical protein KTR14_11200 [Vampirovibrio sp.]|nr:hypothetical protein [Vampirovibrio sp.]